MQGARRLSSFGKEVQEIDFSEAVKTGLKTLHTPQTFALDAASGKDTHEIVFELIYDSILNRC